MESQKPRLSFDPQFSKVNKIHKNSNGKYQISYALPGSENPGGANTQLNTFLNSEGSVNDSLSSKRVVKEIQNFDKVLRSQERNRIKDNSVLNISDQRNVFTPQLASKKIWIPPHRDIKHYMSR